MWSCRARFRPSLSHTTPLLAIPIPPFMAHPILTLCPLGTLVLLGCLGSRSMLTAVSPVTSSPNDVRWCACRGEPPPAGIWGDPRVCRSADASSAPLGTGRSDGRGIEVEGSGMLQLS